MALTDSQALLELQTMTLWQTNPVLTITEINMLFAQIRRVDEFRIAPDQYYFWQPNIAYVKGAIVVPDPRPSTVMINGTVGVCSYFVASNAGTSGGTQPTWPVTTVSQQSGQTVVDNGITWVLTGAAPWEPTWDLSYGIMKGWRLKAQKVAMAYDIDTMGQKLSRSQMYKACMDVCNEWRKVAGGKARQVMLTGSLKARMNIFPISNKSSDADIVDAFLQKYGDNPSTGWAIPGEVHYTDW